MMTMTDKWTPETIMDARADSVRRKILLVEDDPAVRRFIHLLLQSGECEIRAYATGSALLADETAIDADGLVADYRSADMDGLTILDRLKEKGWFGPAVLITGYPSPDLSEEAKARGFVEVFDKPLDAVRFCKAIDRMIDPSDRA